MARTDDELKAIHDELDAFLVRTRAVLDQRDSIYRGLWMEEGVEGNLFHLRHKAVRMWRNYMDNNATLSDNFMDDAIDMINYTLFCMYCHANGIAKGE